MAPLLKVQNLKVHFHTDEGVVEALRDVSFAVARGETVAIVGESGCGKSVMARAILRIVPSPGRIVEGRVSYVRDDEAIDLTALDAKGAAIRDIRGADIAMIFQEPMATFSPVHTIGNQINEAIMLHQGIDQTKRDSANAGYPRSRRHAAPIAHYPSLSASIEWRDAAARDDRHGAFLPSATADRRRTDHRARCDHASADLATAL